MRSSFVFFLVFVSLSIASHAISRSPVATEDEEQKEDLPLRAENPAKLPVKKPCGRFADAATFDVVLKCKREPDCKLVVTCNDGKLAVNVSSDAKCKGVRDHEGLECSPEEKEIRTVVAGSVYEVSIFQDCCAAKYDQDGRKACFRFAYKGLSSDGTVPKDMSFDSAKSQSFERHAEHSKRSENYYSLCDLAGAPEKPKVAPPVPPKDPVSPMATPTQKIEGMCAPNSDSECKGKTEGEVCTDQVLGKRGKCQVTKGTGGCFCDTP